MSVCECVCVCVCVCVRMRVHVCFRASMAHQVKPFAGVCLAARMRQKPAGSRECPCLMTNP